MFFIFLLVVAVAIGFYIQDKVDYNYRGATGLLLVMLFFCGVLIAGG